MNLLRRVLVPASLALLSATAVAANFEYRQVMPGLVANVPVAAFTYSPVSAVDFGSVTVNNPVSRLIQLTNSGTAAGAVPADSLSFSGTDAPLFTKESDSCSGVTLAPQQSCTYQLRFAPTSAGSKQATASLRNARGSTTIALSGAATGAAAFTYSPSSAVSFGNTYVGSSVTAAVTVTNTGTISGAIPGNSFAISGTDAAMFQTITDGCSGKTLAVNSSCSYLLQFKPTAAGPRTANVTFANGTGSAALTLSGSAQNINYAILDYASRSASGTLSADGLTWSGGSVAYIRSTVGETGSFYMEVERLDNGYVAAGMTTGAANVSSFEMDMRGDVYVRTNTGSYTLTASYGGWGAAKVGMAWNPASKAVSVYYDGQLKGSFTLNSVSGALYPLVYTNGGAIRANFGQAGFGTRAPAGFKAGVYQ